MPIKSEYDVGHLEHLLREQHYVITREQALGCGMSRGALDWRVAAGGSWQKVLPGVYLAVTGTATQNQKEMAALLYAGPRSLITGPTAVRRHNMRCPGPDAVDVLIPWHLKRQSTGFVRIHRTRLMPEWMYRTGKIRFVTKPRAVADAARGLARFSDVRAVVCEALQRRACTIGELNEELQAGPLAGSAWFRKALAEVSDGVRSPAECDFRILILRSSLPKPMFNARLYDADGGFIATVDAWWQREGVAVEIDSRAYHTSAQDQDRTTLRHDDLTGYGILPLHFPPTMVKAEGPQIIRRIANTLEAGRGRPPLPITAIPLAA